MGKSRSATCVVAYLMHRYHISPQEALDQIRQSRPLVEPNEGFMQQLEMYHRMNTPINVEESPVYQRWMYQREVQISSECGMAPEASKIRYEDEHLATEDAENAEFELKCKKCRRTLATSAFLIPHQPPPHNEPFPASLTCAHHFLDPLSWMRDELGKGEIEGRFDCPKCKAQVGKYSWKGMRCSCGKWETPAITLAKSRSDEVRKLNAGGNGVRRGPGVGQPATRAGGRGLL
jgi:dual specificity phosphatase 12